jgi:hypothetical protein
VPPSNAAPAVDRYLARLRTRAALFLVARAIVAAIGAAGLALAIGALGAGPLAPVWAAYAVWVIASAAFVTAAAIALRPIAALRGSGAASLLARARADLVSPARSAFELATAGAGGGSSSALIEAHAQRLRAELAGIAPASVVPWRWLRHPTALAGAAALVAGVLLVTVFERAAGGAWALMHPGGRDAEGIPIAAAFHDVRARLVFPGYLARASQSVGDPGLIEVPAGTTIELSGRTRIDATAAELEIGGAPMRMEREDGRWVARFLARGDTALALRVRGTDGDWIRDAVARSVHVLHDEAPRVALLVPAEDEVVEGDETVPIVYEASDDVGIAAIDLVVRGAGAREQRRRVGAPENGARELSGDDAVILAELGAQPGDRIEVWIEARDGDDVAGPNVGRSESRWLTVASAATRREAAIAELAELVDHAIAALGDRLERPPPPDEPSSRARLDALRASTDRLVFALDSHASHVRGGGRRNADSVLYSEASARLRRLLFEEAAAHGSPIAPLAARQRIDERAVAELEDDVLLLADLLTRARIEDAAEIARELEALRREIASLLAELRRADTPEARAQQRLEDLMQRMSRLGTSVPEDFANTQEQAQQTADALTELREAIERGDLDAAQQQLTRLEQQIDALARALGSGEQSFAEERFGPRERALAEALDRLMGLEAEQRELARRTGELRGRAARRALETSGAESADAARRLARLPRAVREALAPIDAERLSTLERDAYDAVVQRLRDTEDALGTGDLGEASRMIETAEDQLHELARDLDLDSMMFPGHDGHTARAARAAEDARHRLAELHGDLDGVLPDLADHLAGGERGQMEGDAPRQRGARGASSELAESFDHGPDAMPLSPDAATALREIARVMDDGTRGLERGDPAGAARAQEEAARRLTELRESVEQDMQRSAGGGGGGDGGTSAPDFRRPVHIHDADEFAGPMELRRRLLDAMQESAPSGYEESVQRYYEGLLR